MKRAALPRALAAQVRRAHAGRVIRLRLEPGASAALPPARRAPHGRRDYAQHVMALREEAARRGLHRSSCSRRSWCRRRVAASACASAPSGTVKWAVEQLKEDYFAQDPDEILDIWLFKDDAQLPSAHAGSSSATRPTRPTATTRAQHQALVMNIATGGGTLVHEIVHPFMRGQLPRLPAPGSTRGSARSTSSAARRGGTIVGYTNWRLPGLQEAIRAGARPLVRGADRPTTERPVLRRDDRGTNYAQARYLCYYLQEHGLLDHFYRDFLARQAQDPTGYRRSSASSARPTWRPSSDAGRRSCWACASRQTTSGAGSPPFGKISNNNILHLKGSEGACYLSGPRTTVSQARGLRAHEKGRST